MIEDELASLLARGRGLTMGSPLLYGATHLGVEVVALWRVVSEIAERTHPELFSPLERNPFDVEAAKQEMLELREKITRMRGEGT